MTSRLSIPVLLIVLFAGCPALAQIYCDAVDGNIRVMWGTQGLPADTAAFEVRSRELDAAGKPAGEWKVASAQPIRPGAPDKRDLADVESDAAERERVKQRVAKEKEALTISNRLLANGLDGLKPEDTKMVQRLALHDFDFARLLGFGYTDRRPLPAAGLQYGLFVIAKSGDRAAEPVATCVAAVPKGDEPELQPVNPRVTGMGVKPYLTFQYPVAMKEKWGGSVVRLSRSAPGANDFKKIADVPTVETVDGKMRYIWIDSTGSSAEAYEYQIAPLNRFGSELPVKTVIKWTPAAPPAK